MNFHGSFMNVHVNAWTVHALFIKDFVGCSWTSVHELFINALHELFMKTWWIAFKFMNFGLINTLIHECSWIFIYIFSWIYYSWKFHKLWFMKLSWIIMHFHVEHELCVHKDINSWMFMNIHINFFMNILLMKISKILVHEIIMNHHAFPFTIFRLIMFMNISHTFMIWNNGLAYSLKFRDNLSTKFS